MSNEPNQIASIIEKISVFNGLSMSEARQVLRLCQQRDCEEGATVYAIGEPSTEMLVLLRGRLRVTGEQGTVLAEIRPGTLVGEMGVLTGKVRSATVTALVESSGFAVARKDLLALFRTDQELRVKMMENVVDLLCDRLAGANVQIEDYAAKGEEPLAQTKDESRS